MEENAPGSGYVQEGAGFPDHSATNMAEMEENIVADPMEGEKTKEKENKMPDFEPPQACVQRIIKAALPENAQVTKESKAWDLLGWAMHGETSHPARSVILPGGIRQGGWHLHHLSHYMVISSPPCLSVCCTDSDKRPYQCQ